MMRKWFGLAFVVASVMFVCACRGYDASVTGDDESGDDADATSPSSCVDTRGIAPRLLLTGESSDSELAVFNLQTRMVEGHFAFAGFGATSSASSPYLMEQSSDFVVKLDPNAPWNAIASWNVRSNDVVDGGQAYADPSGVFVPACTKGYVLRYNRNRVAIIDTTKIVEGSVPDSYIDLSSLVQPEDKDGVVEMTSAVFVPSKNRLYVLLGNVDLTNVSPDGWYTLCGTSKSTIIAIDTTTDKVVSLGGAGPGGGIVLRGYNPPINGNALVYDAALDRLLVMHAGCNMDNGDGTPGAMQQRMIESVDLATGETSELLSMNDRGFPSMLAYADVNRAAIGFFGQAFFWDSQSSTLGDEIPGGMDAFAFDGENALVGARKTYLEDGTPGSIELVRVPFSDAGAVEKMGENPFSDNAGTYLSGAEIWPHP